MIKFKNIVIVSTIIFLVTSCGGNKNNEEVDTSDSTKTSEPIKDTVTGSLNPQTKQKFNFAISNIPSPAFSIYELSAYQSKYDVTFLNDLKKIKNYTTEFQRASNLGIYNVDMFYAIVNDKGEDVLKYLKNVLTLGDELGLKSAVDAMIGKRAENNISNQDSLFRILDEVFIKSDTYLRNNDRVFNASIIFTGGWVESLYLICKNGQNAQDNATAVKVYNHLWEQQLYIDKLIGLLNDFKAKPECTDLITDLNAISASLKEIKEPRDMDDAKFNAISAKVYALRDKLTK
ncbi:MAG: hypothetical protein SFY56_15055 [Bacteroidota bacterium]|nr:hypothetical protein [Bacteroidota bacterium]